MREFIKSLGENRTVRYNIIMVIITIVIVSASAGLLYDSLFKDDQKKTTELIFDGLYDSINSEFLGPIQVAKTMSTDPMLIDLIKSRNDISDEEFEEELSSYLNSISSVNEWSTAFFVLYDTSEYYRSDGFVKIISEENGTVDKWYYSFINSEMAMATDVNTDEFNKYEWTIFIDRKVYDENGDFIGVCGVGYIMTDVVDMLKEYEEDYGVTIYFLDTDGEMVVDSEDTNLETSISIEFSDNLTQPTEYWGENGYVMSRYIDYIGWYLVVENSQNSFSTLMTKLIEYVAVIVVLLVIMILIFNYALASEEKRKYSAKATTDPLTGIPNRAGINEKIAEFIEKPMSSEIGATMYLLDLDHFKDVNDTLGHSVGDQVLQDIAVILMSSFRANDVVGRLGGDEFMVFCPSLHNKDTARSKARQINEKSRLVYSDEKGNSVAVTVSIGSARYPEDGDTFEQLYKNADQALYFVKNTSRDGYKEYISHVKQEKTK
ncbi:MAG: GGDEF domain-containing protein [Butyrivibrio sp.]|nr:GGDEF domain-containing protein [Butyrivibrio sp.]